MEFTDDQIRPVAHQIYQRRKLSGEWGSDFSDWLSAIDYLAQDAKVSPEKYRFNEEHYATGSCES